MQAMTQFILRQSGFSAFLLLLFAVINGGFVGEGLWQGSGLHGFTLQPGAKGGPPYIVSTWEAFMEMLVCLGLALLFGLTAWRSGGIKLWFGRGTIGVGRTEAAEPGGRQNGIRPKRGRVKRH